MVTRLTYEGERSGEERQRNVSHGVDGDQAHRQLRNGHHPPYQPRRAPRSSREEGLREYVAVRNDGGGGARGAVATVSRYRASAAKTEYCTSSALL